MRVALASTSTLALPTYRSLLNSGHQVTALILKEERPSGRGQVSQENELARILANEDIEICRVSDHDNLRRTLERLSPDLVIAISFGMLVRRDSLLVPKHGWLNLHFSLLPRYRGAAPVQRAILDGAEETGLSVFRLDEGMDTGPIYRTRKIKIDDENAGQVLVKLSEEGAEEIVEAIAMIERGVSPSPQRGEPTLAPKIRKSETEIVFASDASDLLRKIRAFSPSPGAWCHFRGQRLKILEARLSNEKPSTPGSIIALSPLTISCGSGSIELISLQESGKRAMNSAEWLRGARLELGEEIL